RHGSRRGLPPRPPTGAARRDTGPSWPPADNGRRSGLDTAGRWLSGATARAAAWVQAHRVSLGVGLVLLTVVGVVHGVGLSASPAPVDDEGTYVAQAWSVQVHHAMSPYTYWYDHPPLAWIQIAGWTWLTHGFRAAQLAVASGRQFMLVAALASAGLIYVVARRLGLRRGWAAVAVLAWGLSPLAVSFQRQVYLDNVAVPWLLGALALALTPRRQLWAYAGAGGCLAVAVLCKETMVVFAPAVVLLVWQTTHRRTRAFCLTALGITFALVASAYPLYALLKGELWPGPGHVSLFDAVRFQLVGRQGSGSVLNAASPAHGLVSRWLAADHWLLGAGFVLLPVAAAVRRLRPLALALAVPGLVILRGGYLPEPYVIGLLPFAALVVAGAGDTAWGRMARWSSAGRRSWAAVARRAAVLGVGAAVLAGAAPAWASGLRTEMTHDQWAPTRQSEAWIEAHVPRHSRVLIDDTMWVDLVQHGFNPNLGVVWFYKLGFANNLDPSVTRRLPAGWRDFDYVVSTPSMRGALAQAPGQLPQVSHALAHSTVVAAFGSGTNRIEIRHISTRSSSARIQ
ncbi:MAG TPA: glycosyltransferase family 39 protein, partial [Acidimicrobiales bacterium]|nr:glycosyltransferase family 39 protein [Acidimicrobiales bacterium]